MCRKLTYLISFLLVLALAGTNVAFGAIVWEGRISSGDDDVEEGVPGGGIDLSSSDLEMPYEDESKGNPQVIGLRFVNVAIAQGAQIAGAYIEFEVDEDKGGNQVVNLLIDGELSPDAALISTWTQWNIPLSDFSNQGVVLTNVNTITIGLGDRNNPQPGGSGMMYVDDIRLYR